MRHSIINTTIGSILIGERDGSICLVKILSKSEVKKYTKNNLEPNKRFFKDIEKQFEYYFCGKLKKFDVNLSYSGTPFQESVWKELLNIPYGTTISYKELAININNPKSSRAVGTANSINPIHIIIPCHRVIGSTGKLTGYAAGIDKKEFLLDLENKNKE